MLSSFLLLLLAPVHLPTLSRPNPSPQRSRPTFVFTEPILFHLRNPPSTPTRKVTRKAAEPPRSNLHDWFSRFSLASVGEGARFERLRLSSVGLDHVFVQRLGSERERAACSGGSDLAWTGLGWVLVIVRWSCFEEMRGGDWVRGGRRERGWESGVCLHFLATSTPLRFWNHHGSLLKVTA